MGEISLVTLVSGEEGLVQGTPAQVVQKLTSYPPSMDEPIFCRLRRARSNADDEWDDWHVRVLHVTSVRAG